MGYSTTVAFVVTAGGVGRFTWGLGASIGLRYFGTATWPWTAPQGIAATASTIDAALTAFNIRRRAAFSNQVCIVSTDIKFTNLKRSLSLPLPKPAICPKPVIELPLALFIWTRPALDRYLVVPFYLPHATCTNPTVHVLIFEEPTPPISVHDPLLASL
jgi:hypothetical protein